jgi:hypothetical protein
MWGLFFPYLASATEWYMEKKILFRGLQGRYDCGG